MVAGEIKLADGSQYKILSHAVDRWWERGASGAARFADALARLTVLTEQIGQVVERPEWVSPQARGSAWISVGPDIVLVVGSKSKSTVVTTLVRGGISDAARDYRNRTRRARAHVRAARRQYRF